MAELINPDNFFDILQYVVSVNGQSDSDWVEIVLETPFKIWFKNTEDTTCGLSHKKIINFGDKNLGYEFSYRLKILTKNQKIINYALSKFQQDER